MKLSQITLIATLCLLSAVRASEYELFANQSEGFIDAKMHRLSKDGRDPDQRSFFEHTKVMRQDMLAQRKADKEGTHLLEAEHGVNIDVNMAMMWDLNHAVVIKTNGSSDDLHLIPTTRMSEMVLMHESCTTCWSMHDASWSPDWKEPVGGKNVAMTLKKFDYIHMLHVYEVEAEGHYWRMNACLDTNTTDCATDLFFYAVSKATPRFNSLGDGYLGLSPSRGIAGSESMNALDQIHDRGMISQRMFGVHTHLYNSTEDPSEIRFGGYNEELFKEGHKQVWMNTTGNMTWEVKFDSAGFHDKFLWNNTHALIDPGYPFIGMPFKYFKEFESDLAKVYPDHKINCTTEDWCQFTGVPCGEIEANMPDLHFTFPVEHQIFNTAVYRVPAKSFLFSDFDFHTETHSCHLGVVAQKYSEFDHFILGQVFMENFYVTYDATNPDQLRVGLSYMEVAAVGPGTTRGAGEVSFGVEVVLIITAVIAGLAIALIGIFICVRQNKQARLAKAKAYFASLQTHEDDADADADADAEAVDPELEYSDPNSFVHKENASKKDEEATIYEEANNDDKPDAETENEQALGNLF